MNARARLADVALAAFLAHLTALFAAFLLSLASVGQLDPTPATAAVAKTFRIVVQVLACPMLWLHGASNLPDAMALTLLLLNSALWAGAVVLIVHGWRRLRLNRAQAREHAQDQPPCTP